MGDATEANQISKRVAVIGAGVSGITTAKHLRSVGVDVVVFERSTRVGGNWLYDDRKPLDPTYPSLKASQADPWISRHGSAKKEWTEEDELIFAPPGPAYPGLVNNVSTKLQTLKGFPWPEGTPDYVSVLEKQKYIQSYAENFGILSLIRFSTRVEKVDKVGSKWRVSSIALTRENGTTSTRETTEEYDSFVVASGHYHASKIPDVPGLKEWKEAWPSRVQHSKSYRGPEDFRDQTALLIGAGVSSADVARECLGIAKRVYQSSRGGAFDFPQSFLPEDIERVAGISSFSPPSEKSQSVTLTDGRILEGIDRVVVCTGYLFSLPFLTQYHNDDLSPEEVDQTTIATDGLQLHNLHKDIFYIPDPTLLFVGVPAYTATYTFFEFQSIAVAAVVSGRAYLPSIEEQRKEYDEKVKEKGYGRGFHSLMGGDVEYVDALMEWLNRDAKKTGGETWEPYDETWKAEKGKLYEKYRGLLESKGVSKKEGGKQSEFERVFSQVPVRV